MAMLLWHGIAAATRVRYMGSADLLVTAKLISDEGLQHKASYLMAVLHAMYS